MNDVTAIVTLYHPNDKVRENMAVLSSQVKQVILVDNSSQNNEDLFCGIKNKRYVTEQKNLGLPGAFNKVLKDETYQWQETDLIIFFDQDSRINEGYIDALADEYCQIERIRPDLGCMGPIFYNTSNGTVEIPHQKTYLSEKTYAVKNTITSSLMTRYKNLKKVGFWNSNLFLDLADWDLCWRMEKAGMLCCMTERVTLYHSVGNGQKKVGPIKLRQGQPFREYYQTRDALYLLQENYVPAKMRLRLIANLTVRPIVHYLFLDHKKERMQFIKRGFADHKNGLHGEL